jgi:hypothetical protein
MQYQENLVARPVSSSEIGPGSVVVRRSFALVALAHPRLRIDGWVRFLRRAARPKGRAGVVFLEDLRGYPHAVFRYAVDDRPSLGATEASATSRTMRLSDVVAAEVAAASRLPLIADFGERLAAELGCETVLIELPRAAGAASRDLPDYLDVSGGIVMRPLPERSNGPKASAAASKI